VTLALFLSAQRQGIRHPTAPMRPLHRGVGETG